MVQYPHTPEQENIEYKTCSGGRLPEDFWEVVTGFSNAEGGTVYLGVKPDGAMAGLAPGEVDQLQRDVLTECTSSYSQVIYPEIHVEHNRVVMVYFPPMPAAFRPIYLKRKGPMKGAKVRVGAANIQVDGEWVRRFALAAQGGAELVEYEGDWSQIFDESLVQTYLKSIREKRGPVYAKMTEGEILIKLRAIANNRVTLFGVLAFGKDYEPQDIIGPTVNVAVTQYRGTTKVDPTDTASHAIDDREFNGGVLNQFENAYRAILSKIPVSSKIDENGRRKSIPAIPPIAIREALANALVHRDYSFTSSRVQIDIYSDRIELINPGRSLIAIDELDSAHSETRNPLIMSYMKDLGFTEQRARGIRTIRISIRTAGLIDPIFENRGSSFVVTIFTTAVLTDNDIEWLEQFETYRLNERQLNALVAIRHAKNGINNAEYRKLNHMYEVRDDIRAKKELRQLVDEDLLAPQGDNRGRRYVLGANVR